MGRPVRILQFSQLINRHDFMDVIVRNADPSKFTQLAATFTHESNIEKPEYEQDGYEHIAMNLPFKPSGFFFAISRLAAIIRSKDIDIVHAHHYYEAFIASLAVYRNPRCKLVITRHYHNELLLTTKGLKLSIYLLIERFVNRRASLIISPSTQITELLIEQGADRRKIRPIPYGFNFRATKYKRADEAAVNGTREQIGVGENEILIGNFGRHHSIKGQDLMLRSFAEIIRSRDDVKLLMVGNGPYHSRLIELAREMHIMHKVIFMGWQKEIHPFLSAVDIVWHPTLQEAFPQIMIEAMALSRPLFITPVSGATDVVTDEVNGFLIPFSRPDNWTDRILSAISDRKNMRRVGENAAKSVMSFDIDVVIKKMEAAYMEIA